MLCTLRVDKVHNTFVLPIPREIKLYMKLTCICFADTLYQDKLADWIVLWSSNSNESFHTVTELEVNATDDDHTYKLVINKDTSLVNKVDTILHLNH